MKKIATSIIILFLIGNLFCSCLVFSKDINLRLSPDYIFNKPQQKLKNIVINQNNISFDLKIREENGEWKDENVTTYIGSIIEFKIEIETNRGYPLSLNAILSLPTTDNGSMFEYIENSETSSKKTTLFNATNEDILFCWLPVLFPTSITCSFKVRIKEIASEKEIFGMVVGIIDEDNIDNINDSINITSKIPPNPKKPDKPKGPESGFVSENYTYSSTTTDPYNSKLYYRFYWGDNTYSEWIGPNLSGILVQTNKSWNQAENFNVRVQAKNTEGFESDWSDNLIVNIKEKLEIIKPIKGIYIRNSKLINFPVILIIGEIDIQVNTPGIKQAESVEFYINGELKYIDITIDSETFSWLWTDIIFGKFELKIIAYDNIKNSWELKTNGFKFL